MKKYKDYNCSKEEQFMFDIATDIIDGVIDYMNTDITKEKFVDIVITTIRDIYNKINNKEV